MTPIEQAIEALELAIETSYSEYTNVKFKAAIAALRSMPAGPVAWTTGIQWNPESRYQSEQVVKLTRNAQPEHGYTLPLYATPHTAPLSDAGKYRECLEWVRGHIGRYDPPGLPNHIAQKIDEALAGDTGGEAR